MNQVVESVMAEKVAQQANEIAVLRSLLVALVWKIGQGKPVTVPSGVSKQATRTVASVDFRQLRSGEIRFTVKQVEEGNE